MQSLAILRAGFSNRKVKFILQDKKADWLMETQKSNQIAGDQKLRHLRRYLLRACGMPGRHIIIVANFGGY